MASCGEEQDLGNECAHDEPAEAAKGLREEAFVGAWNVFRNISMCFVGRLEATEQEPSRLMESPLKEADSNILRCSCTHRQMNSVLAQVQSISRVPRLLGWVTHPFERVVALWGV